MNSWFELIFAGTAFSIETALGAFAIRLNSRKLFIDSIDSQGRNIFFIALFDINLGVSTKVSIQSESWLKGFK